MSTTRHDLSRAVIEGIDNRKTELLILFLTFLGLVAFWELLSIVFSNLKFIFVPISQILSTLVSLPSSGEITPDFVVTIQEIVAAVSLAVVVGIPLGTLIGRNRFLAEGIEPLIYYTSSVPKIVIYPILLILFGVGIESKIAKGFISALFPILVNTIVGIQGVHESHINVARMYQATKWQRLVKVYLPSTITPVVNGLRLGASVAVISVVLGELFASQQGLGNLAQFYYRHTELTKMYTIIIIIFLFSLLLNAILMTVLGYLALKGYGSGDESDLAFF